MKRYKRWFAALAMVLSLMAGLCPVTAAAQETENAQAVWITGLTEQDTLRLYQLTSSNAWAKPVREWLERKDAPEEFRDFGESPALLFRLQPETADRFAQLLVLAMRDSGSGANLILPDLDGSLTWNPETEYWEGRLLPGAYLLLPTGNQRIYSPQLLLVSDGQVEIRYEDPYFVEPSFAMTVSNAEGKQLTDESFLAQGSRLLVRAELNPGHYPDFFPQEKLVRVLSCFFGPGQTPDLEDALVQRADLETSLQVDQDYALEMVSNVTVFLGPDNSGCFYESNGLFYFMDGSAAGKTTRAGTLDAYNLRYGTALTEADLKSLPSAAVVILTLEQWEDPLVFQCPISVGNTYIPHRSDSQIENGAALLEGQYHFTVSPFQTDPLGRLSDIRQYTAYSVEARLLDGGVAGDGDAQAGTPLTGGAFTLYRLVGAEQSFTEDTPKETIDSWVQRTIELNEGQGYQLLWLNGQARVYVFHSAQAVDDQGIAGFGALEPEEYLMVETIYPQGYATLRSAYQITPEAWKYGSFQTVTWRNYTGVYLPETGGMGTQTFTVLGTGLLLAGLFLMIGTIHRKKENEL